MQRQGGTVGRRVLRRDYVLELPQLVGILSLSSGPGARPRRPIIPGLSGYSPPDTAIPDLQGPPAGGLRGGGGLACKPIGLWAVGTANGAAGAIARAQRARSARETRQNVRYISIQTQKSFEFHTVYIHA